MGHLSFVLLIIIISLGGEASLKFLPLSLKLSRVGFNFA